jgi:hypothetical protein
MLFTKYELGYRDGFSFKKIHDSDPEYLTGYYKGRNDRVECDEELAQLAGIA